VLYIKPSSIVVPPAFTVGPTTSNVTATTFRINTTATSLSGAAITYEFWVGTTPTNHTLRGTVSNSPSGVAVTYDVTGLTANTTYYYYVKATDSNGTTSSTNDMITTAMNPPTITGQAGFHSRSGTTGRMNVTVVGVVGQVVRVELFQGATSRGFITGTIGAGGTVAVTVPLTGMPSGSNSFTVRVSYNTTTILNNYSTASFNWGTSSTNTTPTNVNLTLQP